MTYVDVSIISVNGKTVDNVQFGSTLFDVPFEVMHPTTGKP